MPSRITRSMSEPIRERLTWEETWKGPDEGLIFCWELGRQESTRKPELAAKAKAGELPPMDWKGGIDKKMKNKKRFGTLKYLATWQGLREEDLDIDLERETPMHCSRTGQLVIFTRDVPDEE